MRVTPEKPPRSQAGKVNEQAGCTWAIESVGVGVVWSMTLSWDRRVKQTQVWRAGLDPFSF